MSNTARHTFETPEQLHAWLQANHASETELWVRIFKKSHRPAQRARGRLRDGCHRRELDRRIRKSMEHSSLLHRFTPLALSIGRRKKMPHA